MSIEREETSFKYNGIMLVLGMLQGSSEDPDLKVKGGGFLIFWVEGGREKILGKKNKKKAFSSGLSLVLT